MAHLLPPIWMPRPPGPRERRGLRQKALLIENVERRLFELRSLLPRATDQADRHAAPRPMRHSALGDRRSPGGDALRGLIRSSAGIGSWVS